MKGEKYLERNGRMYVSLRKVGDYELNI